MEGRFLDSDTPAPEEPQRFEALGHAGSQHYAGLETFDNPGCHTVTYVSDEVVAHCPVTGQIDFYQVEIMLRAVEKCIESKSLKLWLGQFNNPNNGIFCEGLSVFIRDQVGEVLGIDPQDIDEHVQVTLIQKSRGGISIRAVA